jgi:hypothetical protein
MPRHPEEGEEVEKTGEKEATHLEQSTTAPPWRHGGTAWPLQRQAMAKPGVRQAQRLQRNHGEAHGHATALGSTAGDEAP